MTSEQPDARFDQQGLSVTPCDSTTAKRPIADALAEIGESVTDIDILISYDVVKLLSEQLYASPVKAVEELVVNGWDAGAAECSVLVDISDTETIAVFDNGCGMTQEQLTNLWHIGVSRKPPLRIRRKQIGKFGIGKLASYAVASRATYISKSTDGLLSVTINFDDLATRTDPSTGIARPLPLSIRRLGGAADLRGIPEFERTTEKLVLPDLDHTPSWTLVLLENLRERASALASTGRLQWVLETAMPFASDFQLRLNGDLVESNKRRFKAIVEFSVGDIRQQRLDSLNQGSEEPWVKAKGCLVSRSFPGGVSGTVVVTEKSLYSAGGKSEDLGRSHGFFVRVHKRLVNETDPLFGARPLSFSTWYHFAAEIEADDLNDYITASRDDFEQSDLKPKLRELLIALFNEARDLQKMVEDEREKKNRQKTEGERENVSRELIERPLADALSLGSTEKEGDEWSLLDPTPEPEQISDIVESLYDDSAPRRRYRLTYAALGPTAPFVMMSPIEPVLTLNEDHELVQEHYEKAEGRRALELFAIAEVMLETYMREANISREVIRELISRRDLLLRSLAADEAQSLAAIAQSLRENAKNSADSKALEIAVVGALRALGFAAVHVSGSKTPDGVAGYQAYGVDNKKIIIEAKASIHTPSLGHLDLAGIHSHAVAVGAQGAILISPGYPAAAAESGEINLRADQQRISCWTVEQLAQVVERAERRHINAVDIQDIIFNKFSPIEVTGAVRLLLETPVYDRRSLYRAILEALDTLAERLTDRPRNLSMIAGRIIDDPEIQDVSFKDLTEAAFDLARVSRGLLHITEDGEIVVLGDRAELRRRAAPLTELSEPPRRRGSFRDRDDDISTGGEKDESGRSRR